MNYQSPTITTARLTLRPYGTRDRDALHALWTDPAVRKYLFDDDIVTLERVDSEIRASIESFARRGCGQWAVFPRSEERLIGFCGYRDFHDPPELQLLYGLHPKVWGNGFATEAAGAAVRFGFEELRFTRIVASADAPNTDSFRVMVRIGMTFDKQVSINGLDTSYYTLSRDQFRSRGAPYLVTYV